MFAIRGRYAVYHLIDIFSPSERDRPNRGRSVYSCGEKSGGGDLDILELIAFFRLK